MHVQAAEVKAAAAGGEHHQKQVSSDAMDLLNEYVALHGSMSTIADDDDDERLNGLFTSLIRLSKALSIELRIAFEVVTTGMPQRDYDKDTLEMVGNQNDEQVMRVLNALLRSERRAVEGCPMGNAAAEDSGCPMGFGDAAVEKAAMAALASASISDTGAAGVAAGVCPAAAAAAGQPGGGQPGVCPVSGSAAGASDAPPKGCPMHVPTTTEVHTPAAAAAAAADAPPPAPEGDRKGKKEAAEFDESLSAEQRAKIEAKRKAKEDKAAQKALSKAAKKAGGAWKSLGNGTSLVRMHLASQLTLLPTFSFRSSVAMLQG
jgi:hypothetical protein